MFKKICSQLDLIFNEKIKIEIWKDMKNRIKVVAPPFVFQTLRRQRIERYTSKLSLFY